MEERKENTRTTNDLPQQPAGPRPSGAGAEEEMIETVPLYRNFKIVIPGFVLILLVAAASWQYYVNARDFISTDDAYIDANRVTISSKMLGRIERLLADEGDTVRAGQVLVNLDPSDLRAQETQSRASLALAQENIALAKVGVEKAQTDFKRSEAQLRDNAVTKEQYDHAESELESSRARLNIALASSASARAQVGIVTTQLDNTVISSPMRGVVSKRWVLTGDVIQPGQPIFSVYDVDSVWITANLEETHLAQIHPGDRVEIGVDAYPGRAFTGRVLQIGSNTASQFSLIPPNNASGNFTKVTQRVPVKISIGPAADTAAAAQGRVHLLPGMSVEVKVRVR